jgi:hypothetical protein
MLHMLRFSFSFLLLAASFSVFSQDVGSKPAKALPAASTKDSLPPLPVKTDRYGLRVGVDVYRLGRSLFDEGYRGVELVGDYRLTKKLYAAAEIGNLKYTVDDTQVNFTTNGSYIKIGFDYNAYQNWLNMENMIYTGVRYGFSNFSQRLNSYKVYQNSTLDDTGLNVIPTNYLDEVTVQADRDFSGLSAHWIELVGGAKAELFDNLFLGVSVRINVLITDKKPTDFDNLFIPGFNRTYDGNFGVGLNYTLSYFIPLYKKQASKTEDKKEGKKL